MQRTLSGKVVLLLALIGALALAGCGGDDGVSQSLHDQALAEREAAEEAARMAAEQQAAAEEAARMAAEQQAAAEEAARMAAEQQAAAEEAARMAAEQQAAAEEAARMAAEQQAAAEEAARMEAERAAAEEAARLAQEQAAADAETARLDRIDDAMAAIATAETASAAQAAYDVVKDDVTVVEGVALQTAVDMRIAELETMARADMQTMAMTTAAGNIDTSDLSTQAAVDAAKMAIYALEAAITAALDASDADKAMYEAMVTAAKDAVMMAQGTLDHASQMMTLSDAVMDLQAIDLTGLTTQDTIDAAQAAIDALQNALNAATELNDNEKATAETELDTVTRTVEAAQGRVDFESQTMALTMALDDLNAIDLDDLMTQDQIDDANAAIIALDLALAAATDLTEAQTLDARHDVKEAKAEVMKAEDTLAGNIDEQRDALSTAGMALAALDTSVSGLMTQADIDAVETAVNNLKMALDDATHLSESDKSMYQMQYDTAYEAVKTAKTGMDRDGRIAAQRLAITDAVTAAETAIRAVNDTATAAQVMEAEDAIADLKQAIADAEDLPAGDTGVAMAQGRLSSLENRLADAKTSRMTAMDVVGKAKAADMAATAAKLYAGIKVQFGDLTTTADNARFATYNAVDQPTSGTAAGTLIQVNIGDGNAANVSNLSADKDTMVADNHGWEGMRYADPADGPMVEAIVYSNVEEPKMGRKFGAAATPTATSAYLYELNADGELTGGNAGGFGSTGVSNFVPDRVALTGVIRTAGMETFKLPEGRPQGETIINVPGRYHGVSGTYNCDTGAAGTNTCTAAIAGGDGGFTLGGTGTWVFKPSNAEARVMETEDTMYASYGWWIHKAEDDGPFIASAFHDQKGGVTDASGLDALNGTATYMGGAAGKYALSSSTGGTNDAGHFTARAMLEANFTKPNTDATAITGTIDMFIGADGETRDWEVTLKGSTISDVGVIGNDGTSTTSPGGTVWSIRGEAADAKGQWAGTLRNNGSDGVPQVATGTFYSEYNGAGKIVGAFGANKQ